MEKIIAFIDYRYEPLQRDSIIKNYLLIILFNSAVIFLSKGTFEKVFFTILLSIYLISSLTILIKVINEKFKSYLYRGLMNTYLTIQLILTGYYLFIYGSDHNLILLIVIFSITMFYNFILYRTIIRNINNDIFSKFTLSSSNSGNSIILFIASLSYLLASVLLSDFDNNTDFKIIAFCLFVLAMLLSAGNMILLKAYYMYKYNFLENSAHLNNQI